MVLLINAVSVFILYPLLLFGIFVDPLLLLVVVIFVVFGFIVVEPRFVFDIPNKPPPRICSGTSLKKGCYIGIIKRRRVNENR